MLENGTERIYFKQVLSMINLKTTDGAKSWCNRNEVTVFKDGARNFVIKAELDNAYDKPIIEEYKKKYGDQWMLRFELLKDNKLYAVIPTKKKMKKDSYKPKSDESNDFLNEILN